MVLCRLTVARLSRAPFSVLRFPFSILLVIGFTLPERELLFS